MFRKTFSGEIIALLLLECGFGEDPLSKMVSEPILDPLNGPPTILSMHQAQKCWA